MATPTTVPRIGYRKILYTTDLSETGRNAFPHAASIAARYGAELTVIHVVEGESFEKYLDGYISEDLWNELKTRDLEEAKDILIKRKRDDTAIVDAVDQSCQEALEACDHRPYVQYQVMVKAGDPVEEIVAEAHDGGYDLVVLGKQGHRAIKDTLMGSTTWRVLHKCALPVLVVRLP